MSAAKIQNTSDLRKVLLEVMMDLRSGSVEADQARAIASISAQVLKSAHLDFEVSKHFGDKSNGSFASLQSTTDRITDTEKATEDESKLIQDMKKKGKPIQEVFARLPHVDKSIVTEAFTGRAVE